MQVSQFVVNILLEQVQYTENIFKTTTMTLISSATQYKLLSSYFHPLFPAFSF